MREKSIKVTSLFYDPAIYGLDNSFWKTTVGSPTFVSNKIRLNSAEFFSVRAFRYGHFKFNLNIAIKPTAGQVRSWGLASLSGTDAIKFDVTDTAFTLKTTDAAGTTTTTLAFTDAWATAEVPFEIVWSNEVGARSITVSGNGSVLATITTHIPQSTLFAFVSNGTADNLDVGSVIVDNTEDPFLPVDKADTNFLGYEADTFTIAGITANVNVHTTDSNLFNKTYKQVTIKVDKASTVKLNSASNGAISLGAGEVRTFDNFLASNMFITTTDAGTTTISIDGWY